VQLETRECEAFLFPQEKPRSLSSMIPSPGQEPIQIYRERPRAASSGTRFVILEEAGGKGVLSASTTAFYEQVPVNICRASLCTPWVGHGQPRSGWASAPTALGSAQSPGHRNVPSSAAWHTHCAFCSCPEEFTPASTLSCNESISLHID